MAKSSVIAASLGRAAPSRVTPATVNWQPQSKRIGSHEARVPTNIARG
jgi:hypothetical protein